MRIMTGLVMEFLQSRNKCRVDDDGFQTKLGDIYLLLALWRLPAVCT